MFEFIRKHTKWMMVLLFALIIPSFVFFGFENYQRMNDASHATVAVVDGQKITQAEWDEAHRSEADRQGVAAGLQAEGSPDQTAVARLVTEGLKPRAS